MKTDTEPIKMTCAILNTWYSQGSIPKDYPEV